MYVGFVAVSGYNAGKFLKQMNLLEIIKASNEHSLERSFKSSEAAESEDVKLLYEFLRISTSTFDIR